MWLVAIAWIYVVGLMSVTETSIVAGVMTFVFYCVVPLGILFYLTGGRARRARREAEQSRSRTGSMAGGTAGSTAGSTSTTRKSNAAERDDGDAGGDSGDSGSDGGGGD